MEPHMSPKKLKEYESRGVGLLTSGAYIMSSFPERYLEEVATQDWASVSWEGDPRLIIIRSKTRGAQARFGQVSCDGRWLSYPTFPRLFGSVALFRPEIETIHHFVRRAMDEKATVWEVRKPSARATKKSGRGFLVGPNPASRHNALLCCDSEGIHLIPFELDPPPHATHESGHVLPVSDSDAREAVSMFQPLSSGSVTFDPRYKKTSLFFRTRT
jgi:hypothetical protein